MVTRTAITVLAFALLPSVTGCMARGSAPAPAATQAPAAAPAPPPARAAAAPDPIERALYPVELVMERQAALGLTEPQKAAIRTTLQETQTALVDLELRLGTEKEALATALAAQHPDEAAALAAAEKVVRTEGEIKLAHLRLLVRVKTQLTPAQQALLDAQR